MLQRLLPNRPLYQFQVHEETGRNGAFLIKQRQFNHPMRQYLNLHLPDQIVPIRGVFLVVYLYTHALRLRRNFYRVKCFVPLRAVIVAGLAGCPQLENAGLRAGE